MKFDNFKNILELLDFFSDETACIEYLEWKRWKNGVISPFDPTSTVYKCKNNRYKCKNTGKYFNVKTGTFFENSKVSLRKWFLAIYIVTSHKKGISSIQLSKDIGVTQKTAWNMLMRIRECYGIEHEEGCLDGIVECDETFVGGKNKNRHKDKKVKNSQGRSFKDKTPVFGMLQRDGKLIAMVVANTKEATLKPIIEKYVKKDAILYTDEWWAYRSMDKEYDHHFVNHGIGFYGMGDFHTNSIEGSWASLKKMIIGVYHNVSRKHLQLYVNEFAFRYNYRNVSDSKRFELFLHHVFKQAS
ncbi:MAG: IS1595 family transposase [Parabacteroides sp.]|nr:IS1595 family transposase [Parabacteroides sp.]